MITTTSPDNQRIQGHRLGFSQLKQNPVSAIVFLSYQPDLKGDNCIAAVLAELNGAQYDQIHILAVIESDRHNRIELSKTLLKLYNLRPYAAIYADIDTLKWFNSDNQFTNLAEIKKELHGWSDYPAIMGLNRYQLSSSPTQQAEAEAWQATVLDQVESMGDSLNQPVLRYVKKIEQNQVLMQKFKYRGKSVAVDALAGACYIMLSIADDLRWQFLNPSASY